MKKFASPNSRQSGASPKTTPRENSPRKEGSSGRGHEIKVKFSEKKSI